MLPNRFSSLVDDCAQLAGKFTLPHGGEAFLKALTVDAVDIDQAPLTLLLLGSPTELAGFSAASLPALSTPALTLFDASESAALYQFRHTSRVPRSAFGGGADPSALHTRESTENITGAAWLRLLVGIGFKADTVTPTWGDYLQQFVDVAILMPSASQSPGLAALATALSNTHALAVILFDPASGAAPVYSTLTRSIVAPVSGLISEPKQLPGIWDGLRAPVAARRCIGVAERVRRELQYERERVSAAQGVNLRAGAPEMVCAAPAAAANVSTISAALNKDIESMLAKYGERTKVAAEVSDEMLIDPFDDDAIEWTEVRLGDDVVVPSPNLGGTRLKGSTYKLGSSQGWRDDMQARVARVVQLRLKKDRSRAEALMAEIAERINSVLAPFAGAMTLPTMTSPVFDVPSALDIKDAIQTDWGSSEPFTVGGITNVFTLAQGILNRFIGVAVLLGGALIAMKKRDITQGWIVAAIFVVMFILYKRMPIGEKKDLARIKVALRARALVAAGKALASADKVRVGVANDYVANMKAQLVVFLVKLDQLGTEQIAAVAAEHHALANAVKTARWVFNEKLSCIDSVMLKATNCIAQLTPLADSAVRLGGERVASMVVMPGAAQPASPAATYGTAPRAEPAAAPPPPPNVDAAQAFAAGAAHPHLAFPGRHTPATPGATTGAHH